MKKCSNCFELKSEEDFYKKLDRLQSRCKSCNAEVCAGYRERAKERVREELNQSTEHSEEG